MVWWQAQRLYQLGRLVRVDDVHLLRTKCIPHCFSSQFDRQLRQTKSESSLANGLRVSGGAAVWLHPFCWARSLLHAFRRPRASMSLNILDATGKQISIGKRWLPKSAENTTEITRASSVGVFVVEIFAAIFVASLINSFSGAPL